MNSVVESLNAAGGVWWVYAFHATWTSSLVAAVLLAVVWVGRRWPAQLRHAIILIALVKFAVPPILATPVGIFSIFGPAISLNTELPPAAIANAGDEAAATGFGALGAVTWKGWLLVAHALGLLVAGTWAAMQISQIITMSRRAKPVTSGPLYEQLTRLSIRLGLRRRVRLLVTDEMLSPMAFGVLRPRMIVSASVRDELPPEQLETVLAHELAHHRRGDLIVNWIQMILTVVWWFNPVVRLLTRASRKTSEDCCDDILLSRKLTTNDRYCRALLSVAGGVGRRAMLPAAMGFAKGLHPLAGRITRIMDPGLRRLSRLSMVAVIPMVILAAVILPGLPAETPVEQVVSVADSRPTETIHTTAEATTAWAMDMVLPTEWDKLQVVTALANESEELETELSVDNIDLAGALSAPVESETGNSGEHTDEVEADAPISKLALNQTAGSSGVDLVALSSTAIIDPFDVILNTQLPASSNSESHADSSSSSSEDAGDDADDENSEEMHRSEPLRAPENGGDKRRKKQPVQVARRYESADVLIAADIVSLFGGAGGLGSVLASEVMVGLDSVVLGEVGWRTPTSLTSPLYVDPVQLFGLDKAFYVHDGKSIALSDDPVLREDADLPATSLLATGGSDLRAVPEPATLCLLSVGCVALLARRRRF